MMLQLSHAVDIYERGDYAVADDAFLAIGGQRAERGRGFCLRALGDLEGSLECFETAGPVEEIGHARNALGLSTVDAFAWELSEAPASIYNFAAALHAEGIKARGLFCEAIARDPGGLFVPEALRSLAEYETPKHAWRLVAQADDMEAQWQQDDAAQPSPTSPSARPSSRSR